MRLGKGLQHSQVDRQDSMLGRDRPIIGFTDLFNRYRYRLIGIDTHHIGIGKIGIGMV